MPRHIPGERQINAEIGRRLRARRKHRGMDRQTFGKHIGVSHSQVGCYETGEHMLTVPRLLLVCHVLQCTPGYFIDDIIAPQIETAAEVSQRPPLHCAHTTETVRREGAS